MGFKFDENTKTISEINQLLRKDELIVDHSYQRRKIWTNSDKIRLIETILLNYVVPSVYFGKVILILILENQKFILLMVNKG